MGDGVVESEFGKGTCLNSLAFLSQMIWCSSKCMFSKLWLKSLWDL